MGHRLQQFLSFGRIIDLGEFLRQNAVQSVGIKEDFCGTLRTFVGLTPLA